jgi:hypothetical protein
LPLDGRQSTTAHTTTNQKQASATLESIDRMCTGWEARGEVQYHCFGGNRVGKQINTKIKLSSLQINFFLLPDN